MHRQRDDGNLLRFLDDIERNQRLLRVAERLADDEIDARIDRPADLLLEHRTHCALRSGIRRIVDVRIADVAGEERAAFFGDGLGEIEGAAVDRLEIALAPDDAELLAVRVIRQRFDDVRACMNEVAMELRHRLGMLEHDFGHECAGLQVTPALELEDIALGANHRAGVEALQQRGFRLRGSHVRSRREIEARLISHLRENATRRDATHFIVGATSAHRPSVARRSGVPAAPAVRPGPTDVACGTFVGERTVYPLR